MIIDLVILAMFLSAAGALAYAVLEKLPFLLQVPSKLIEESFVTRPSRVKKVIDPALVFIHRRGWRDLYAAAAVRLLHALRLWLLRLERVTYRMLEAFEARERGLWRTEERYWSELKQWKHESNENGAVLPPVVLNPDPPPPVIPKESSINKIAANGRKPARRADQLSSRWRVPASGNDQEASIL